jgi:hypothetical protein
MLAPRLIIFIDKERTGKEWNRIMGQEKQKRMLKNEREAAIIASSNPVLADCTPTKGAEIMLRQSDKITALYCRLSRDDEL